MAARYGGIVGSAKPLQLEEPQPVEFLVPVNLVDGAEELVPVRERAPIAEVGADIVLVGGKQVTAILLRGASLGALRGGRGRVSCIDEVLEIDAQNTRHLGHRRITHGLASEQIAECALLACGALGECLARKVVFGHLESDAAHECVASGLGDQRSHAVPCLSVGCSEAEASRLGH